MKSKANSGERSQTVELFLVMATAALAAASLFGPAQLRASIVQFSLLIWGAVIVLSFLLFRNKGDLGLLLLAQAMSVMVGAGAGLKDANEVPFGLFGGLIWGAVLSAAFVFGLLYFSQFVLPLTGNEGWSEGLRLLVRMCCTDPVPYRPPAGKSPAKRFKSKGVDPKPAKKTLPSSFATLRAGMLISDEALSLSKGAGFSRPAGPGFVMLYKGEKIAGVIDLREHLRTQSVKAITRDGIPIETDMFITFRVRQSEPDPGESDVLHPYQKDAIFQVSYASSIGEQDELRAWTDRLCPLAADLLATELAQYTLNELYQGDDSGVIVLETIKQKIERRLERVAVQDGIELLEVGFGHFELPPQVTEQRIKTWRADWQRKIAMQRAAGDAEALRRIKKARARVQIEIIENITQNIQTMRDSGDTELTEIIMLRMIEALEKAISNESVKMLVPQQVLSRLMMDSSKRLQAWVTRPIEDN